MNDPKLCMHTKPNIRVDDLELENLIVGITIWCAECGQAMYMKDPDLYMGMDLTVRIDYERTFVDQGRHPNGASRSKCYE